LFVLRVGTLVSIDRLKSRGEQIFNLLSLVLDLAAQLDRFNPVFFLHLLMQLAIFLNPLIQLVNFSFVFFVHPFNLPNKLGVLLRQIAVAWRQLGLDFVLKNVLIKSFFGNGDSSWSVACLFVGWCSTPSKMIFKRVIANEFGALKAPSPTVFRFAFFDNKYSYSCILGPGRYCALFRKHPIFMASPTPHG